MAWWRSQSTAVWTVSQAGRRVLGTVLNCSESRPGVAQIERPAWRDQTLVVFVSPSAQESFDLWYDTPRQKAMLEKLCKAIPVAIWSQIKADQDIAVEQIVGGNGGKGSFQFSCRKYLSEKTTD
jgi:hypothetical protein